MIEKFGGAVTVALREWNDQNGYLPKNILYYRDGVAESRYDELEQDEVSQLRRSWSKFAQGINPNNPIPQLRLPTVIVTKRHSTRLFPATEQLAMNRNENCQPGTLVDSVITSRTSNP
jgi:eukaryotic translation initiation factor 2C